MLKLPPHFSDPGKDLYSEHSGTQTVQSFSSALPPMTLTICGQNYPTSRAENNSELIYSKHRTYRSSHELRNTHFSKNSTNSRNNLPLSKFLPI
jgi:hypothetical protein